jgi:hypothetical protein
MAVPTLTNNSPSAGYIAWGAFNIQYQGVSYSVSAGNTNLRWTWWRYSGGSPVVEAGADIPTNLTDDDLVLFGNRSGIGVRVQSTQYVDGDLLIDGSVLADAIGANQITGTHLTGTAIDGKTITGATINLNTGGVFQTSTSASTGIKIDNSQFIAYGSGVPTFSISASTGGLTLSGTIVGAGTIVGPKFKTNVTASRGVEIDSAGLRIYDGSGTQNFTADSSGNISIKGSLVAGSSVASSALPLVGGQNLWTNSSFEDATNYFANWGLYSNGATATRSQVAGRLGGSAVRFTWAGNAVADIDGLYRAHPSGAWNSNWHVISFWARANSGNAVGQTFRDAHNIAPDNITWLYNPPLTTTYQQYAVSFRYVTNIGTTDPFFFGIQPANAAGSYDMDDVKLEEGQVPTAYMPKPDEVLPGSIIGTSLSATAIDGKTITGATFQTASGTGERLVLRNDGSGGVLEAYSGISGETAPGVLDPMVVASTYPGIILRPGKTSTRNQSPYLRMYSDSSAGTPYAQIFSKQLEVTSIDEAVIGLAVTVPNSGGGAPTVQIPNSGSLNVSGHLTCGGTGWTAFPFSANYQAYGGGYQAPQYKRVGNTVYLRGLITRNTATAPAASTAGTMPSGARPISNLLFEQNISGGSSRVDVLNTGAVIHQEAALTVGGWMSLDGIQYDID